MDKRRQSILKQDGRIPLQETVLPDFPEDDTATVTVTKSRRVSFGANFVKEFIVGSAVSAQFFSEYEQAVSSSDSSNQNTSSSGLLDRSTFHGEDDALNLCVKQAIQDEFGHLKKKFCSEKLNSYCELNDRNNENIWDFNVSNTSNIFTEKNMDYSNKPEPTRNSIECNRKANPLSDSSIMANQFQNKRNEPELNSSKMDTTTEKKAKTGKFSSTIFFSADSPTADVEFTEGCISLAKSIFDKKKKEMTVYIKGTAKENKKEDKRDESNTVVFEPDDSDGGMKLTKCMDDSELEHDVFTGNLSKYFHTPKGTADSSDDFDESHENIENVPFHTYSLNTMLNECNGENYQGDEELERSIFSPQRSLTEMLYSDPLETKTMSDVSSAEKDNTEECDMEISSPDVLKRTVLGEDLGHGMEETSVNPVNNLSSVSCSSAEEEVKYCTSPIFSKVAVGGDLSLASEDNTESGFPVADPLSMSMCDDPSLSGNSDVDLLNCSPLKVVPGFAIKEAITVTGELIPDATSSSAEDLMHSVLKEESEVHPSTQDNHGKSGRASISKRANSGDWSPLVENKKSRVINSLSVTKTIRCSLLNENVDEMLIVDRTEILTHHEPSAHEENDVIPETPTEVGEGENKDVGAVSAGVDEIINREMDFYCVESETKESQSAEFSSTESSKELLTTRSAHLSFSNHVSECEVNVSGNAEDQISAPMPTENEINVSTNAEDQIATQIPVQNQINLSMNAEDQMLAPKPAQDQTAAQMPLQNEINVSANPDQNAGPQDQIAGQISMEDQIDVGKNSSFPEDNECSAVFATSKDAVPNEFLSMPNRKNTEIQTDDCLRMAEDGEDVDNPRMEMSMCELNISDDRFATNVEEANRSELFSATHAKSYLQETQLGECSFLSRSSCEDGDQTSLGDKKILSLLTEQSEEPNCFWKIDFISHAEDINLWSFSFPILKSSGLMKFKLRPPKDKSLVSFSVVIDGSIELQESNEYQLGKHRIGIEYAFGKVKAFFQRECCGLDNVHKMPLFLDKMNLMMKKMNGILRQVVRILKEYPGSQLKESVLSFRIYSFPLLFSYLVMVDMSDPFHMSECSVAVKKQFGDLNTARVKTMFKECLGNEESLIRYIRKLTESVVEMESESGFVTRRSHVRLIS